MNKYYYEKKVIKMKKIISLILFLVICFSFVSCKNENNQPEKPTDQQEENMTPESTQNEEVSTIHIASLKGPTSMGLVGLYNKSDNGELTYTLDYSINGAADEISPLLINGDLDGAAVPANLASVLYNKTGGNIVVAAINTFGVLYIVETGDSIQSISDLKGKKIYSTGKGTTPEYALDFLLENNGIDPDKDVTIDFASEATEVSTLLTEDKSGNAVAVLPQPYVTAALAQNDGLRIAISFADEWEKVTSDSKLVTGVFVFNKQFAESNPNLISSFLKDYSESVDFAKNDTDGAAALIEQYGIVAKAPIAKKALPFCNIDFVVGNEMKETLSGYLQTLYDKNPAAVGGTLPSDEFYYE